MICVTGLRKVKSGRADLFPRYAELQLENLPRKPAGRAHPLLHGAAGKTLLMLKNPGRNR